MQAKGVVSKISSKEWKGRNGTVYLYSFVLDGQRDWYRTGTDKPNFNEGDFITFDYTVANNSNTVDMRSVVRQERQVQTAPPVKAGASKENWDARAKYWDDKEKREIEVVEPRITLAAARKDAISVIGLALANEAIVFGNAAKGARLGIILSAIDEVTGRYYNQSLGAGIVMEPDEEEVPTYDDEEIKE